jgi:hypothetical protein
MLVPSFVNPLHQVPEVVFYVQLVVAGTVIGLGRQGLDTLLTRAWVAALGVLLLAAVSWGAATKDIADRAFDLALGIDFLVPIVAILLAVIALVVTVMHNRGFRQLGRLELPWRALLRPRNLSQSLFAMVIWIPLVVGWLALVGLMVVIPKY